MEFLFIYSLLDQLLLSYPQIVILLLFFLKKIERNVGSLNVNKMCLIFAWLHGSYLYKLAFLIRGHCFYFLLSRSYKVSWSFLAYNRLIIYLMYVIIICVRYL
jgi:hypothetical protein